MAPDGLDIVKSSGVGRSTGLECLVLAAGAHRIETSVESIRHEHQIGEAEPSDERLAALARAVGLKAKRAQTNIDGLMALGTAFPVLARLKNGNVVLVAGVTRQEDELKLMVIDPLTNVKGTIVMPPARFDAEWSGNILLVRRPYHFSDTKQPFGLRWFLAEVLRQKGLLRDVMLAALAIQVVGLAGPTYMRVVLDRVLVHQSVATLAVLTAGTVVALAFETGFTYLRTFIMLHATKKIDIRLATRIFAKMLSLPISYFEAVAAGVTIRHLQQADKIRAFLTGRMLGVILEVISFAVYLPILAYLSIKLTLVVLAIGLMIAGTVAAVIGPFRVRLQDLYNAESQRQAMAVETVSGMRTIKSLTLEPVQRKIWEERSANSVEMFNNVAVFGTYASSFTSFLERIAPIAVISIGAMDIFDGNTTVGAVLAFQMLAGRVISPLVQVAALVQEYQDTALSVRMLGEIMNRPSEAETRSGSMRPVVKGEIALDGITFRYVPGGAPALDGVGLKISAGMVVAVVGRSGSGKSTIAKLLQGLYMPQEGVIRIDGVDIREYDLSHLRQNVCVIPQDTFIFRGSVRDNIGLPKPGATLEEIVAAAQSSGANEFIERMPQGYDTLLEEGGQNLSGGQKQRLSIARALLISPPILILDEATSALDPDSEAIFMDNLEAISAGRTTLIISHRLNTLISCDAIIVLERGKIIDAGTHQQLLSRCAIYEHLWKRQNRHL